MKTSTLSSHTLFKLAIILASAVSAFALGYFSSSSVAPIVAPTNATSTVLAGDFNRNGVIDPTDAKLALDIARGVIIATPDMLAADPNKDYHITADDVTAVLEMLNQKVGITR